MKHVPLNATVNCIDLEIGKSEDIVVNPINRQITNIVVKEKKFPHVARLVPVSLINSTSANTILLSCSSEEFGQLEPFEVTEFVQDTMDYGPEDAYVMEPYSLPAQYEVVEERIPPGQLAMRRGTAVRATDGKIGQIDEFIVDQKDGHITHIVLHERHMLSKQTLTLPVSAITKVEGDSVTLNLTKAQVEALPTVPRQRGGWEDAEVELVVLIFEDTDKADEALDSLKAWKKQKVIGSVRSAAVISKDSEGKVKMHETGDMDTRRGAVFGAITGGLIGLLGGPAGVVIGAAAGAATGGAAAKRIDVGLPNEYLESLQTHMEPGTSALVAVVEHEWSGSILEGLESHGGKVFKQALTDDMVDQFTKGQESSE